MYVIRSTTPSPFKSLMWQKYGVTFCLLFWQINVVLWLLLVFFFTSQGTNLVSASYCLCLTTMHFIAGIKSHDEFRCTQAYYGNQTIYSVISIDIYYGYWTTVAFWISRYCLLVRTRALEPHSLDIQLLQYTVTLINVGMVSWRKAIKLDSQNPMGII